jgi:Zn-finger nucleic acid-binding protein
VPTERHDHYTPDHVLTGYTIVTRDPEWTDRDREHIAALQAVKADECPKCGGKLAQTTDPDVAWHVEYDECNRCETVAFKRALDDGMNDADARKQAAPAGRLYRAAAVPKT